MDVTQGDRDRVGDIGRLQIAVESELKADRGLHLLLGRPAAAGERFFDHRGRIAGDFDFGFARSQVQNAASVPHENCRSRTVIMRIELFNRDDFRAMLFEQLLCRAMKLMQSPFEGLIRRNANDAGFDQTRLGADHPHHRVTGTMESGIESYDLQRLLHLPAGPLRAVFDGDTEVGEAIANGVGHWKILGLASFLAKIE